MATSKQQQPVRIGIIREGKVPSDSRVALAPAQAAQLRAMAGFDVVVQPSEGRCFPDADYVAAGVPLQEDLSDRDVLIGVKEVPIAQLIPGKTYFFFSHTHKKQSYNRSLLQSVVDKGIRLIDYELLTDDGGARYIAFGKFAGMVGAHHALRAWGLQSERYALPQMVDFVDYAAAKAAYAKTDFGSVRIVVTGTGRVGQGAAEVLRDAGVSEVSNEAFLAEANPREAVPGEGSAEEAVLAKAGRDRGADGRLVFTQVGVEAYVNERGRRNLSVDKDEFYANPERYESNFLRFARVADVMIHGIFWDHRAPAMFTSEEMGGRDFRIRVISDVTCDIAPVTSVPATLRASTIAAPYFGFDPDCGEEIAPFDPRGITMCTIDNLPNELPRDASEAFGEMFLEYIAAELLRSESAILGRATIAADGALADSYRYLEPFLAGHA